MSETIHRCYPLALTPDALLTALASPDVVRRRSEASSLDTTVVTHEAPSPGKPGELVIVTSSDVPLTWFPPVVTSRITETPRILREERWTGDGDDGVRSPLTFDFSGMPVTCDGLAVAREDGAGSVLDVSLTMRVDVPFFGGVVERALVPQIVRALDTEAAFYATL